MSEVYMDPCDSASYDHRVDDPDNYNWCIVPESGQDAILFAAVALFVCVACSHQLSALWILLLGAITQAVASQWNLGRLSNSFSLWLGLEPSEIFFYIFLPPLLLDSAVRVDFYIFKKVMSLSLVFAFVIVAMSTAISVPLMLYGLGLAAKGWTWVHCGLFSAMVGPTDAVAVASCLKAGGAPEVLSALLEGESLFNDASGLVLFDIFLRKLQDDANGGSSNHDSGGKGFASGVLRKLISAASIGISGGGSAWWSAGSGANGTGYDHLHMPPPDAPPHHHTPMPPGPAAPRHSDGTGGEWQQVLHLLGEFAWLAGGGTVVGLIAGYITTQVLHWAQWRRLQPHVEVTVSLGGTYLAFFVANAYLTSSGVIACVVYGLYGAATMTWHMSLKAKRQGSMNHFWDVLAYAMNGVIFFFVGASAANFIKRLSADLEQQGHGTWELIQDLGVQLPAIYLSFSALRAALIALFVGIARVAGSPLHIPWQGVVFATVSLILAQTVLTMESDHASSPLEKKVIAQMGLWTAGFVLLTLIVNAPLITPLMGWLRLNTTSHAKQQVRMRARSALQRYTEGVVAELRGAAGGGGGAGSAGGELRAVDWSAVARYVNLDRELEKVLPAQCGESLVWAAKPVSPGTLQPGGSGQVSLSRRGSQELLPVSGQHNPLRAPLLGRRSSLGRHGSVVGISAEAGARGAPSLEGAVHAPHHVQSTGALPGVLRTAGGSGGGGLQHGRSSIDMTAGVHTSQLSPSPSGRVLAGTASWTGGLDQGPGGGTASGTTPKKVVVPAASSLASSTSMTRAKSTAIDLQYEALRQQSMELTCFFAAGASTPAAAATASDVRRQSTEQEGSYSPPAAEVVLAIGMQSTPDRHVTGATDTVPLTQAGLQWGPGHGEGPRLGVVHEGAEGEEETDAAPWPSHPMLQHAERVDGAWSDSSLASEASEQVPDWQDIEVPDDDELADFVAELTGGANGDGSSMDVQDGEHEELEGLDDLFDGEGGAEQGTGLSRSASLQAPSLPASHRRTASGSSRPRSVSGHKRRASIYYDPTYITAVEEALEPPPIPGSSTTQARSQKQSVTAPVVWNAMHAAATAPATLVPVAGPGADASGSDNGVNAGGGRSRSSSQTGSDSRSRSSGRSLLGGAVAVRRCATFSTHTGVTLTGAAVMPIVPLTPQGLAVATAPTTPPVPAGVGLTRQLSNRQQAVAVKEAPEPSAPGKVSSHAATAAAPAQPHRAPSPFAPHAQHTPSAAASTSREAAASSAAAHGPGQAYHVFTGTSTATRQPALELRRGPGAAGGSTTRGPGGGRVAGLQLAPVLALDGDTASSVSMAPPVAQLWSSARAGMLVTQGSAGDRWYRRVGATSMHARTTGLAASDRRGSLDFNAGGRGGVGGTGAPSNLASGVFGSLDLAGSERMLSSSVSGSGGLEGYHMGVEEVAHQSRVLVGSVPDGSGFMFRPQARRGTAVGGRISEGGSDRVEREGEGEQAPTPRPITGPAPALGAHRGAAHHAAEDHQDQSLAHAHHLHSAPNLSVGARGHHGHRHHSQRHSQQRDGTGQQAPAADTAHKVPSLTSIHTALKGHQLSTHTLQALSSAPGPMDDAHLGLDRATGPALRHTSAGRQGAADNQRTSPFGRVSAPLAQGEGSGDRAGVSAGKAEPSISSKGLWEEADQGTAGGGDQGGSQAPTWGNAGGVDGGGNSGGIDPSVLHDTLVEYRIRLLSGLKRHFHAKHCEGLLSSRGLRLLDYCCDAATDATESAHSAGTEVPPLELWDRVEAEVTGRGWVRWQAGFHFRLRQLVVRLKKSWTLSVLAPPLYWLSQVVGGALSRAMMAGVEVALEVHAALTDSPQAQWVRFAGAAGAVLQEEMQDQVDKVWQYIVDREIEAPDRFQAIQTHRAAMAVLCAQQSFVNQLFDMGMIDAREQDGLMVPIERRMWKLETNGPRWKHPSLQEVLTSVPFLAHISQATFDWLRAHGELVAYHKGDLIASDARPGGIFVVVSGMVRITLNMGSPGGAGGGAVPRGSRSGAPGSAEAAEQQQQQHQEEEEDWFYVGTGGVGGLTQTLLGRSVPGMSIRAARAEGNALGKGPLVFHMRPPLIAAMRSAAAAGDSAAADLELSMFRMAGAFILDRQRVAAVNHIVNLLMSAVATAEAAGARAGIAGPGARRSRGTRAVGAQQRRPQGAQLRALLERPRGMAGAHSTVSAAVIHHHPVEGPGLAPHAPAAAALARVPSLARSRSFAASALRHAVMDAVLEETHSSLQPLHHVASSGGAHHLPQSTHTGDSFVGPPSGGRASNRPSRQGSLEVGREGADVGAAGDEEQGGVAGMVEERVGSDNESCENGGNVGTATSERSTQPETISSSHLHPPTSSSLPFSNSVGGGAHPKGAAAAAAAAAAANERLMRRCFERALDMFDAMKMAFAAAELVVLAPRQTITQSSSMLLVNGSLVQTSANLMSAHLIHHAAQARTSTRASEDGATLAGAAATGSMPSGKPPKPPGPPPSSRPGAPPLAEVPEGSAAHSVPSLPVYKPPALLVWLPAHLEYSTARFFVRDEEMQFTAGPTGAALLVCEAHEMMDASPFMDTAAPDQAAAAAPDAGGATRAKTGADAQARPPAAAGEGSALLQRKGSAMGAAMAAAAAAATAGAMGMGSGGVPGGGAPAGAGGAASGMIKRSNSTRWNV